MLRLPHVRALDAALPFARYTASALLVGPLAGCIFLVSDMRYGTECHFQGEGTACGACLASACRAAVDACCLDSPTMDLVDKCASDDPASCRSLDSDRDSHITSLNALATCIADHCRSACPLGSPRSRTECEFPIFSDGQACHCTLSATSNDVACGVNAPPGVLCCAPDGWPGEALRCQCNPLGCSPDTAGCSCGLFDLASQSHSCTGTHCCARADWCACSPDPCAANDREVPECQLSAVTCPAGQHSVDTCNVPLP